MTIFENAKFINYCFDESLRVEEIIPIGSLDVSIPPGNTLKDFIDENSNKDLNMIFGENVTEMVEKKDYGSSRRELIIEQFYNLKLTGFLIHVSTPERFYDADLNGHSFSWSQTYTDWIYVSNLENDAEVKIKKWLAERITTCKKKKRTTA